MQRRVFVYGEGNTGKSTLILRLKEDKFYEYYDPSIEDSYDVSIPTDHGNYDIIMFEPSACSYCFEAEVRRSDLFLFLLDMTLSNDDFLSYIEEGKRSFHYDENWEKTCIVFTKSDLCPPERFDEVSSLARMAIEQIAFPFISISSFNKDGFDTLYKFISQFLDDHPLEDKNKQNSKAQSNDQPCCIVQ